MAERWNPPRELDEYRLSRLLGTGAMGQVYLAHDTVLDRPVAIKFIGALDPSSALRERFLVEARAVARVQHPNVVSVYRVGELGGRPYLISEFIRGESLDKLKKPLPPNRVLDLGIGLARGLAAAHRRGVLHRDIKTANAILADNGDVKLVDFGLAKLVDRPGGSAMETRDLPVGCTSDLLTGDLTPERLADLVELAEPETPAQDLGSTRPGAKWAQETRPGVAAEEPPARAQWARTTRAGTVPAESSRPELDARRGNLTRAGAVMGTPFYVAPEQWAGQPASRRSDVYSLGVLMFELCTGHPPFIFAKNIAELSGFVRSTDAAPLASCVAGIDPRFAAVVDRCLSRDPEARFGSGDELREALEQISFRQNALAAAVPEGNPYRGLHTFEREHRALFFGRGAETRAILERLRNEPFVLVTGDSGSGKSSLCRAGVLPLVEEGALDQGRAWTVATIVPGKRPYDALMAAIGEHHREGSRLLLFVDQLEELVTTSEPEQAHAATEALFQLVSSNPGLRVLATVRGDFLTRIAALPGIADEIPRAMYLLGPLTPRGLVEAITGPAEAKNTRFEDPAIVEALAAAGARTEGGLPLLQFALAELWDARDPDRKLITREALDAIGGVDGALARHADSVIAALLPAQRRAAQRLFARLVTAEGSKARKSDRELGAGDKDSEIALAALVRGRLLIARELEEGTSYELAHASLLKSWRTLREWLDRDGDKRLVIERLSRASLEWERLGAAPEALWHERQLREAAIVDDGDLGVREAAFLAASRSTARRALWRRRATAILVPLALGLAFAGVRVKMRADVERKVAVNLADAGRARTSAAQNDAEADRLRAESFALFDTKKRDDAENAWARALESAKNADESYGRAAQALEAALALDPTRADVRASLGQILYDRAVLAERDERPQHLAELLRRLDVYDETGELRRRFEGAPAELAITTTPPGAEVTLEREGSTAAAERHLPAEPLELMPRSSLGQTPLAPLSLERGTYTLVFHIPGRARVRYPIRVARGEKLSLDVEIPPASAVPEEFVYVPAGRFAFGSTADEELRRDFFNTAPLHDTQTGAYLIARHETTYRDWIEFLRALPARERATRTPRLDGGFARDLDLVELAGGTWQLRIQPTTERYVANEGQTINYHGRDKRSRQDWLRFPVSGISVRDAEAYLAWLDASGKVPGARFCTDFEWERAARGADGRSFPGSATRDPNADDFNFDETYSRNQVAFGADEVGSHPSSKSPFGVDDLAGNVWELVRSSLADGEWVARGGSYHQAKKICRAMNREIIGEPTFRDITVGLRVCADPKHAALALRR